MPALEIKESWHGVDAKHSERTYGVAAPVDGVRIVTVSSGSGMTLSFGIAQETLAEGPAE